MAKKETKGATVLQEDEPMEVVKQKPKGANVVVDPKNQKTYVLQEYPKPRFLHEMSTEEVKALKPGQRLRIANEERLYFNNLEFRRKHNVSGVREIPTGEGTSALFVDVEPIEKSASEVETPATHEVVAAPRKGKGRPKGKSSDPSYETVSFIAHKELRRIAERRWEDSGQKGLSNLIEALLGLYTVGALDEIMRQRIEAGDRLH